jgi:hypothetical protein
MISKIPPTKQTINAILAPLIVRLEDARVA